MKIDQSPWMTIDLTRPLFEKFSRSEDDGWYCVRRTAELLPRGSHWYVRVGDRISEHRGDLSWSYDELVDLHQLDTGTPVQEFLPGEFSTIEAAQDAARAWVALPLDQQPAVAEDNRLAALLTKHNAWSSGFGS